GAVAPSPFGATSESSVSCSPACEGLGVKMFFSENFDDIAAAKSLCIQCPIRERCLDEAVSRGEQYGVWGGQLFEAGRIVIAKRRRGRPAKIPRPGDSLPEVEVPAAYQRLVVIG
ncbi:MAG: WhiB family transcriptional regulator, partial [Microthrixaceae bacterium]|nr:WhiB family transcriptional regulator [Microthrixaceae bacterium]